ncbi:MAG: alpha/beta hydrolase [Anaerolineales bacterium]|nr:alpha/beta hydrolase [Anaerolineales bacterium]
MNSFELSWKSKDGIDLFGRAWESGKRKPKALICHVHGLGEHSGRYVHVAQAFTNAGYAMLSFDLRGHGRSGGARGHIPSFDAFMDDLDILFEQARSRYPGLPMFLYGHSLGGILILNYGLRRKPDIKGMIATGSGLHTALEQQPIKIALAKVLGTLIPNVSMPSGLNPGDLSRDHVVIQAYINDPLVHDKISLGFGKNMLEANRYALDHAAEFPLPLLLMHGKEDKIAFPSSSIEFAAPLKDKCTLMLWDGWYHEVHNEPEKTKALNTMTIWMDARLA